MKMSREHGKTNKADTPIVPPMLGVTDSESVFIGTVPARVGLVTHAGKISRFTEKSVWCIGRSGSERLFRKMDGPLPSVTKHFAGKAFVPKQVKG